ncbi:MAG: hypothetical protein IKH57_21200 [Clostridia bacterium]|nr:hypothetical protein [Clostridia bacterium]
MLRQIYTVTATQVVVSESHPEGVLSKVSGYPVDRDSRNYEATEQNPNGNPETALIVAQADYATAVRDLTTANNPNRVMWAVTLTRADGVQIARKSWGAFPDMTPAPDPPQPENQEQTAEPTE